MSHANTQGKHAQRCRSMCTSPEGSALVQEHVNYLSERREVGSSSICRESRSMCTRVGACAHACRMLTRRGSMRKSAEACAQVKSDADYVVHMFLG